MMASHGLLPQIDKISHSLTYIFMGKWKVGNVSAHARTGSKDHANAERVHLFSACKEIFVCRLDYT